MNGENEVFGMNYKEGNVLGMDKLNDKASRGSEVPLRALWCKVTSGGELLLATSR
jgi:hypothetical protein